MERPPHRQGDPKNQPHQIILTLNLIVLKFNDILNVDFLEIQSNVEFSYKGIASHGKVSS